MVTSSPTSIGFTALTVMRLSFSGSGGNQVWSLNQFYSVDFSKSRIVVKKCVFKNTQSRIAPVVVVDSVLGPPRLAQHT